MGPKFIIIFEDKETNEDIQKEKEYMTILKNIKEAVENIKLVQTEQGIFKKEYLDMIKNASEEDEDMIDELDDLDMLDDTSDIAEIEEIEDIAEENQDDQDSEKIYIIPRLNIALKEYDKGSLENICRKLESYLDSEENRGKSEIVVL